MGGATLVVDRATYSLLVDGQPADLEPQAFDVLAHLVEHRDRLVTKEEPLDEVWGDRFVSESALTTRIKQIRAAVGDDGRRQEVVRTVHGRGYQFVGELSEPAAPAPAQRSTSAGSVPAPRTPLVGRDEELAAIDRLLVDHRLVSLVGLGGTGKTRLAMTHAAEASHRLGQDVAFVDLVPVGDVDQVVPTIARAVGLGLSAGDPLEQLVSAIGSRAMLLVLDNCEHVVDSVADVVERVLDGCPAVRFLVTSRIPLGSRDECRYAVGPLPHTGTSSPATALFVAGARRVGAVLTGDEIETAQRICAELDGLPLALELAAAQLRYLTAAELAERLHRRLDLLVEGPERHGSLTAVLDDTWATLPDVDRGLLLQLAAFPGPFSTGDVEAVWAGPVDDTDRALASLIDRCLVVRSADGRRRLRLLETVRLHVTGAADADAATAARTRHADWCLESVGDDPSAHALDWRVASWCIEHHDDLLAAETHLVSTGRSHDAALLVGAIALAMHIDDGNRAADALRRIVRLLPKVDDPTARARLHVTGAYAAMAARAPDELHRHGVAAVGESAGGDDPQLSAIATVLRTWSMFRRDPDAATTLVRQAAALTDGSGLAWSFAEAYLAWHLALAGERSDAVEVARHVIDADDVDGSYGAGAAAIALVACTVLDDPDAAGSVLHDRVLSVVPGQMWGNRILLATVHAARGDAAAVLDELSEIDGRLRRAGQSAMPDLLVPLVALAVTVGDEPRAQALLGAVRAAPRPTQSLQVTCVYRQLRTGREPASSASLDEADMARIRDDALAWASELAGRA